MKTVAVIGAGQMGSGIAQTVAQHGIDVLLADVDEATARAAHGGIEQALGKLVGRGKLEVAHAQSTLVRIRPIADYAPMKDAEIIIEAATEKEQVKQAIFRRAGEVLAADAIMASNTSSIPITRMANYSPDPARFIGLHFFNPVPVMGLIEVIPGLATAKETTDRVTEFRVLSPWVYRVAGRLFRRPAFLINHPLTATSWSAIASPRCGSSPLHAPIWYLPIRRTIFSFRAT